MRTLLLAGVLALLGVGAWWLIEPELQPRDESQPRPRVPDHVVSGFTSIETDDTGRPERRLVATTLWHFVAEEITELELPRLSLYETDGPPWQVEARSGLLLEGGDEVRLEGDVVISREAGSNTRPVTLETNAITIWPKREFAEGDQPVRIESGNEWATGSGIRAWFASPVRAELLGRANLELEPARTPDPGPSETP